MRILAFTDPHGELAAARSVADLARREKPDLILCPGDLTLFESAPEGFFETLRDIGMPVYVIPGNHDSPDTMSRLHGTFPFLIDVSFRTLDVGQAIIAGVPGNDLAFWPGPTRDEAGTLDLVISLLEARDRSKPLIFLAHYPPSRTAIDGSKRFSPDAGGSRLVRRIIEAAGPALAICGHYHQNFGDEDRIGPTRLINPGPLGRILNP